MSLSGFLDFLWDYPIYMAAVWFALAGLAEFVLMGLDKGLAVKGFWRIPESALFLMAAAGGALGGLIGILAFRHKTRHKSFTVGFPLILSAHIALFYLFCSR